jgi:hypothetical protein
MYNGNTNVNGENSRPRSERKFPARPAGVETAGDGRDGQHTSILAVGSAGIDHRPAIGGELAEAWVEIVDKVTGRSGGRFGQRRA